MKTLASTVESINILEGIGIFEYNLHTRIGSWSPEMFELLGRDPEEGTINLADPNPYLDEDERIKLIELSQLVIQEGCRKDDILSIIHSNGSRFEAYVRFFPSYNEVGMLEAIKGTFQNISQHTPASGGLHQWNDSYLSLINHLDEVVFALDCSGKGLFINPAWETFTGRSLAYFIEAPFEQFVYDDDKSLFREHFNNLVSNIYTSVRCELRITDHNNRPVWVEFHARNTAKSSDRGAVSGTLMNIQQRKFSEEQLFSQRLAIENTLEGIAVMNAHDQYVYLNKAHVEMFGFTHQQEVLGKSWKIFYHDDEIERIEKEIFPKFIQKGFLRFESRGKKVDNTPIYQDICLTALPDGGLICITHDISERKAQEAKIREMALVASRTNLIVMVSDASGKISWVNESFTQKFGYLPEDIYGKLPHEVLSGPLTDMNTVETIYSHLRSGKSYQGEIQSYNKQGQPLWLYIDITPVYNEEGELEKFIAVENDITLKKKAEANILSALEKERDLSDLKTQFIHLASHEFRTPMASIQTSMDVLKHYLGNENPDLNKVRSVFNRHHNRIAQEIERMTEIMNNVLLMGRLDGSKMVFNPISTDLVEFFRNLIDEETMSREGTRIEFVMQGKAKDVLVDRSFMTHVFKNLLSNAYKYGCEQEEPLVELEFKKEFFRLSVSDKGIGIPENEIDGLFQSFFRASNAENIQGTGLGLVIIKKLVEMHQGTVHVESKLNQGSRFSIQIPL